MKVLLICKDCGGQFQSPHPDGKSAELKAKAANHKLLGIYLTSCMGVCPEQKISTMVLEDNKTNLFKTESLLPNEIEGLM